MGGRPTSVLVTEDDAILRLTVSSYLRQNGGFQIHEARSGEEALALLRSEPIDILFTDIQLPTEISGWDVAEAACTAHANILLIYASGHSSAANDRRLKGNLFFDKPYDLDEILRACLELAGRRK